LPWRFGPEKVALVTEALYAQRGYAATDMLAVLADKRDPAEEVCRQITLPDGTVASMALDQIVCGQNPHLWARRVKNLRWADPERADAGLVWEERKES
jgi:hypothetical protein